MSLYRCAACGSPNVVTASQAGGYDYVKGAVGTIVLGPGGAVAGVGGKTQQVFKCPDCGLTLDHAMPADIKTVIDMGVMSGEARKNLQYMGMPVDWRVLKRQYKNIEEGAADRAAAKEKAASARRLSDLISATKEQFDAAVDYIVDIQERLQKEPREEGAFSFSDPMTAEEYLAWQNAITVLIENMSAYLPAPLPDKYRGLYSFHIKGCVFSYLNERILEEFGYYPSCSIWSHLKRYGRDYDSEYYDYAILHPFVFDLMEQYMTTGHAGYNGYNKEDDHSFGRCVVFGFASRCLTVRRSATGDNETYYLPRFKMEDGKLYHWDGSYDREPEADKFSDFKEVVKNYFQHYPEKKREYDEKVSAYRKQVTEYERLQTERETAERTIQSLKDKIGRNDTEIASLRKKIFGKAKAQARIAELEQETRAATEQIDALNIKIDAAKKASKPKGDEKAFSDELAQEYGYYIVWRAVE